MSSCSPTPKRVLLLVKRFQASAENPWLTDEIADSLSALGCEVEVALLDLSGRQTDSFDARAPIVVRRYEMRRGRSPRGRIFNTLVSVRSMLRMHLTEMRRARKQRYDMAVVFSIGSYFGLLPLGLRVFGGTRRLVFVVWDFFPGHHRQIGAISRFLAWLGRPAEYCLARASHVVCVMSEAGSTAAQRYFGVSPDRIVVVPPWGRREADNRRDWQGQERIELVFGGQSGAGRQVSWLLDCVRMSVARGLSVHLRLVGVSDAALANKVAMDPVTAETVELLPWIPRSEYRSLLAGADVGIVVTDPRVSFPTFPSKLVDYFQCGLPALACMEEASDVPDLITSVSAGWACTIGDTDAFVRTLETVRDLKKSGQWQVFSANALEFFDQRLDVDVAAKKLLAAGCGRIGQL